MKFVSLISSVVEENSKRVKGIHKRDHFIPESLIKLKMKFSLQ